MDDIRLRILIVDDDEDDYILAHDLFNDIEGSEFELDWDQFQTYN